MKTVKIDRSAGKDPTPLVEAIVKGQTFPFLATLKHKNTWPLVVPSSGLASVIAPCADDESAGVKIKIKSRDQAWMLVSDLAEFAVRANNNDGDFATIEPAEPPPPPKEELQEPAEAESQKVTDESKPAKAPKASKPVEGGVQ